MRNIFLIIFSAFSIFFLANRAISIIIPDKNDLIVKNGKAKTIEKASEEADLTQEERKILLGKKLFFDPILSKDGTVSCASCHKPEHGFADDKPVSIGIKGQKGERNTPTAFNTANLKFLFWDGRAKSLEEQAIGPIQNPKEMGETVGMVLAK